MNSRHLDDAVLTLAASGWTYGSTFVLYDHQTESMWFPFTDDQGVYRFKSIAGVHAGRELAAITGVKTIWRSWVADHPGSKLMQ